MGSGIDNVPRIIRHNAGRANLVGGVRRPVRKHYFIASLQLNWQKTSSACISAITHFPIYEYNNL
jgi:hypothetical protein